MTRTHRTILYAVYTTAICWLAATTITTWRDVPLTATLSTTAAVVTTWIAALTLSINTDTERDLRQQLTNAVRPPADYQPRPPEHRDDLTIPDLERRLFDEQIRGFDSEDEAA